MAMFKGIAATVATLGILVFTTDTTSAQYPHRGHGHGGGHMHHGHMYHGHMHHGHHLPVYQPYYNYYRSPAFFGGGFQYGNPVGYSFGAYNYGMYNNGFGYGYNRGFSISIFR